jgi:hypothetical protein
VRCRRGSTPSGKKLHRGRRGQATAGEEVSIGEEGVMRKKPHHEEETIREEGVPRAALIK